MQTDPRSANRRLINWRSNETYAPLLNVDRQSFAWEWLRRNERYREAWETHDALGKGEAARAFGLVALADPSLPATKARPIWRAEVDQSVLIAEIIDIDAPPLQGLDLLAVASLVTMEVDTNNDEHVLLSDGKASIRLDIVHGTLLGGRALLRYDLWGALRLRAPINSLRRLVALIVTGRFAASLSPPERLAARWVLELRVADALADGASHSEIARNLFQSLASKRNWRDDGDSMRSRVQRLARTARRRRRDGAHLEFLNGQ